jgi:hypothetical protein
MRIATTILLLFFCCNLFAQNRDVPLTTQGTPTSSNHKTTLTTQGSATTGHTKTTLGTIAYAFFSLPAQAKVSAGVYDSSGKLYRTLYGGVTKPAGSNIVEWDGKDDAGNTISATGKIFKIVSNNLTATWQGPIGNSSDSLTGTTVWKGFEFMGGLAAAGRYIFACFNYQEGPPSIGKLDTANPNRRLFVENGFDHLNSSSITRYVATDGINVYWAGSDPFSSTHNYVYATQVANDSFYTFSNGASYKLASGGGNTYPSVINNTTGVITGLAVQKAGSYLFVARQFLNTVTVLNKTTGAVTQTLTYSGPTSLCTDSSNSLWITTDSSTVTKYTVNGDGTLTTTGIALTGLSKVGGIAADNNSTIAVQDAGTHQQVRFFSILTGTEGTPLGTLGGYSNAPDVTNTKFQFYYPYMNRGSRYTGIAFGTNGTIWVNDAGNNRIQHFDATGNYLSTLSMLQFCWDMNVIKGDSSRVFANYLEFHVNYDSSIQKCWTLVKNWGANIPDSLDNEQKRLRYVTILSNGRTYATLRNINTNKWYQIELTSTGVRFIGDTYDLSYDPFEDGSYRKTTLSGGTLSFIKKPLTGFDGSGNPTWGSDTTIATTTETAATDPTFGGAHTRKWYQLPNGLIVSWSGNSANMGVAAGSLDYHLGSLPTGLNQSYRWKANRSTDTTYIGNFPTDGTFDNGNGGQYYGNIARVVDSLIITGYHGEFYKNDETNEYNVFGPNGLFLLNFGVVGAAIPNVDTFKYAATGFAGNAFCWSIVKAGSNYYLYHNDEGNHSAIHRWKISNINSIKVQQVAAKIYTAPAATNVIDLMADVPRKTTLFSTGGWTRNPNTEVLTSKVNNYWSAKTTTKSYGNSNDVFLQYAKLNATSYTLSKNIGTVNSTDWTLSGEIGFPGSQPNNGTGTLFIDILDSSNKIISRFYSTINFGTHVVTIFNNSNSITSNSDDVLKTYMNFERPISIHVTSAGVTVTYGDYAPVLSALWDATANWQHPKTLTVTFSQPSGTIYMRTVSLKNLLLKK